MGILRTQEKHQSSKLVFGLGGLMRQTDGCYNIKITTYIIPLILVTLRNINKAIKRGKMCHVVVKYSSVGYGGNDCISYTPVVVKYSTVVINK